MWVWNVLTEMSDKSETAALWNRRLASLALGLLLAALALGAPAWAQQSADQVLKTTVDSAPPAVGFLPLRKEWLGDFDGMQKRRVVRILVPFSRTFYFIDKGGKQFGVTYETGKAFEEALNKKYKTKTLKIEVAFIPVSRNHLFTDLAAGLGDIAAGNLTVTPEREKLVDFADPFATGVREIVVTGPTAPTLTSLDGLSGQEVFARQSSSYYEHLSALSTTFTAAGRDPIKLQPLDDDLEDEDALEMVNAGLLPWIVVDEHKAELWAQIFDKLTVHKDLVVNEGGEIAWAIRKDSPLLRQEIDAFVATHKIGTTFGNTLRNRYLKNTKFAKDATSSQEMKKFGEIVDSFKTYGKEFGFDYLMLAAQGYQESQLNQSARSPRGAVGVLQMLPSTAADPNIGITGIDASADKNIHAGTKYLRLMVDKYLNDPGLDDKNRTLMAFAAYNAGPGNLRKFRQLAEKSGLDPNVWFHNVEEAAAKVVGRETVQYVSNIYKYYVAYSLATESAAERQKAKENLTNSTGSSTSP